MADGSELVGQDEIERLLAQSASPGAAGSVSHQTGDTAAPPTPAGESKPTPAPKPAEQPTDDDRLLAQDDIEKLLSQAGRAPAMAVAPPPVKAKPAAAPPSAEPQIASADMEYLLQQAEQALASIDREPSPRAVPGLASFSLADFAGSPASAEAATLDLVREVELDLRIELGRTQMYLEEVLKLRKGATST